MSVLVLVHVWSSYESFESYLSLYLNYIFLFISDLFAGNNNNNNGIQDQSFTSGQSGVSIFLHVFQLRIIFPHFVIYFNVTGNI